MRLLGARAVEQVRAQSENVQVGSFAIFPVIVFAFGLSFRGEF